jgi:signal transduction histidine kinase
MNRPKLQQLKIAHQRVLAVTLMDLKAPLQWVDDYVSESITGFGTAADEKFFSKKEYLGIILNSRKQAKGLFFSCKLKTKYAPRFTGENSACFFDEFVVSVGKGSQQMVMHLSVGLVFTYYDNKWKLIALHASKIDTDTSSEDTFHLGEAEKKMQELQMEVAKRTEELSQKNNELKIEAALERVRAIAMGMKRREDMLDVCKIISMEMEKMKVKNIRNVQTAIVNDTKGTYLNYEYFTQYKTTSVLEVVSKLHPTVLEFVDTIKKSADAFFSRSFKGAALKKWIAYRKQTGQDADPILEKVKSVHYYFYSIGEGALGITSYAPLADEEIKLFRRFYTVFNLAYRRFLDIEKAEAQAREAQIEAALERVRARSMAMLQPQELKEVAELLRKEMGALGIEALETSSIYLVHPDNTECWYAIKDVRQKNTKLLSDYMEIQLHETWVGREMQKFYKGKQKQASIVMKGSQRKEWINYCASKSSGLKNYYGKEIPERTYHILKFAGGYMGAVSPGELSPENWDVLRRATAVFALAYTRFKDLQEAANRAREAEIELALERVRARSMAMHKSSEIMEVVYLIADRLKDLKVESDATSIIILHDDAYEYWNANNQQTYANSQLQKIDKTFDGAVNQDFIKYSKRVTDFSRNYSKQEKNKHWKWLFSIQGGFKHIPEVRKKFILSQPHYNIAVSFTKKISLVLVRYQSSIAYTDSEKAILKRFAEVFHQCYTRFLDLQKAEAQAREAQIEVGLERVRSRAMAMQSSEELKVLIATVFNELTKLDLVLTRCIIWVFEPSTKAARWWMANSEEPSNPMTVYLKYHEHPAYLHFVHGWEKRNVKFVYDLKGKDKTSWDNILFNETELKLLPDVIKNGMRAPERVLLSASFNNFGGINVASIDPLSDEHFDILLRFAKVFDLTYTRFLDLQKAEAQAREARIEAALERVRSRSLAMHKSDELQEVVTTLFDQLHVLNIENDATGIVIFKPNTNYFQYWFANPERTNSSYFLLEYKKYAVTKELDIAHQKSEAHFHKIYSKAEKNEFYSRILTETDFKRLSDDRKKLILGSEGFTILATLNKNTAIQLNRYYKKSFDDSDIEVTKRFGNVFEQAYTRFLDLQKAEAQARESQIQLALERVRARTMAMQKSEELAEVSYLLNKQVVELGISTRGCAFNIYNKKDSTEWFSNLEGTLPAYKTPRENIFLKYYKAGQRGEVFLIEEYGKEKIQQHYEYLFSLGYFGKSANKREILSKVMPESQIDHVAYFKYGYLLFITLKPIPEAHDIFKRFAKEFEQTYTRFLDLQKAEAQAKEAKIQLALERVRAKSLAMQNPNDLLEVIEEVSKQLENLGLEFTHVNFRVNEGEKDWDLWSHFKWLGSPMRWQVPYKNIAFFNLSDNNRDGEINQRVFTLKQTQEVEAYLFKIGVIKEPKTKAQKQMLTKYLQQAKGMAWTNFRIKRFSLAVANNLAIPYNDEENEIIKRFAITFEQVYTRFLDLQKAEAQARENQIQLALERVRARTMAMQKSEELPETSFLLFQQMQELGETAVQNSIAIPKEEEGFVELSTTVQGHIEPRSIRVPIDDPHIMAKAVAAWKAKQKSLIVEIRGKELKEYNKFRNNFLERKANFPEDNWIVNIIFFSKGWLSFSCNHKISDESFQLLERFAAVFEQTYTRFLDLQKAEAQAREAEIQLALERVRARTMAMFKSEELSDVAEVLFSQVSQLGVMPDRISIGIIDESNQTYQVWATDQTGTQLKINFVAKLNEKTTISHIYADWKAGKKSTVVDLQGKNLRDWIKYLNNELGMPISTDHIQGRRLHNIAHFSYGWLNLSSSEPLTPNVQSLLQRLASVFNLTYTRFLDLQKAEAQAREAQIEASLEKVRSVAMSMHHSNELLSICEAIYAELIKLGMVELRNTMINIHNDAEETFLNYDYSAYAGRAVTKYGYHIHPIINHLVMQCRSAQDAFVDIAFDGKEFEEWRSFRKASGEKDDARLKKITHLHYYFYSIGIGSIGISTFESIDEQKMALLKRFRNVFQLAYQRFTDLSAAEAQAREAQIETALERVRSRTMAMQNSNELSATVQVMFEECRKLQPLGVNENLTRGFITTIRPSKKIFDLWITEIDGTKIDAQFEISFDEPTTGAHLYKSWKQKKPVFINDLHGKPLEHWLDYLESTGFKIAPGIRGTRRVNTFIYYSNGFIGTTSAVPLTDESIQILQRFAKVFDQTYTRFLDLQKAEAAAKEAIKQAALDRIRADIASMRTIEDLNRITPLIWNELTILGIPFIRCGVFIMDEEAQQIHTYLSTPDGKSIAAFHLSFTESENIIDVVSHWRNKKVYSNHWEEEDFDVLADSLVKQKAITTKSSYLQSIPATGIHLNFLPFLQGMLYVGNELPLMQDEIHLLQAVADAFSTAYARYEDFNKLESAKQVVEKTLNELKSTQQQLIQSEKMASLGELTAGIAHEIQNPLNFVNNFSELNVELMAELRVKNEELGIKNEDINDLVSDIQSNSEKINHHGQRAASIVKGMLQHSRSSSATKELTDINALCDEYLRLAYHGLRAKDKSFNAEFKTEFDPNLPKVNIVPQDMGRVVLNLINNAFFAVSQRQNGDDDQTIRRPDEEYTPMVIVSTRKKEDTIEITVSDNGTGIPNEIKEKIFQPFFTTKPTGQGTGLGLSLAYDIVTKAHGGKLTVESEQGRGTTFKIEIP